MRVKVLIPTGLGINCERESAHAFRTVGAEVDALHLNDLIASPDRLARANILMFAGGFSFGDHLGAGRVLANRLRTQLRSPLGEFISDGGLILGICNGFQTLVRLGLLPSGQLGPQSVALAPNAHGAFYDGWVRLAFDARSPCVFTRGLETMDVPVRHGEGRLVTSPGARELLTREKLVACRYVDPRTGTPASAFPADPNGSEDQIAGICDPSGRIFGMMPHPEAFIFAENHPAWRRKAAKSTPTGLAIFANAVRASAEK